MRTFFILIFLNTTCFIFGQEKGYIITFSNDTLFGLINNKNPLYLKFISNNGHKATYTAYDIRKYSICRRIFESHFVDGDYKRYFAEIRLDSVFDLYYCRGGNLSPDFLNAYYYRDSQTDTLTLIHRARADVERFLITKLNLNEIQAQDLKKEDFTYYDIEILIERFRIKK